MTTSTINQKTQEATKEKAPIQVNRTSESSVINLSMTERGFYEKAKAMYADPRCFVREAAQNASDSGAKELDIQITKDGITITDNGSGMSPKFIIDEFKKVGAQFKGDGQRGHFGVGRLSYWMPLVDEDNEGNVCYTGRVELETRDGHRKTAVKWDTLPVYTVEDEGPTSTKGTTIRIINGNESKLPTIDQIKEYIKDTIVDVGLRITVNGETVAQPGMIIATAKGKSRFTNDFVDSRFWSPVYKYDVDIRPASNKLIITEKGIAAFTMDGLPYGGIMNFTEGHYRGAPIGIMPLSRDKLLLNPDELVLAFLQKGVPKYYASLDSRGAVAAQAKIASAALWLQTHAPRSRFGMRSDVKKLIGNMIFNVNEEAVNAYEKNPGQYRDDGDWRNKYFIRVKDFKNFGNIVWANKDAYSEAVLRQAQYLGYTVLDVRDRNVQMALKIAGVKELSSLERKLDAKYREELEGGSTEEKHTLRSIGGYLKIISSTAKENDVHGQRLHKIGQKLYGGISKVGHGFAVVGKGIGTAMIVAGAAMASVPGTIATHIRERAKKIKERRAAEKVKQGNGTVSVDGTQNQSMQASNVMSGAAMLMGGLLGAFALVVKDAAVQLVKEMKKKAVALGHRIVEGAPKFAKKLKHGTGAFALKAAEDTKKFAKWSAAKSKALAVKIGTGAKKLGLAMEKASILAETATVAGITALGAKINRWRDDKPTRIKEREEWRQHKMKLRTEKMERRASKAEEKRKKWLEKNAEKQKRRLEKKRSKFMDRASRSLTTTQAITDVLDTFMGRMFGKTSMSVNGITAGGISLYLISNENSNVVTFETKHGGIGLNIGNRYVKKLIDQGRIDLLIPDVVHQFIMNLGYTAGGWEAQDAESRVLNGVSLTMAGKEMLLTLKAHIVDGNIILPRIKLTRDDAARLGVRDGSKLQIVATQIKPRDTSKLKEIAAHQVIPAAYITAQQRTEETDSKYFKDNDNSVQLIRRGGAEI